MPGRVPKGARELTKEEQAWVTWSDGLPAYAQQRHDNFNNVSIPAFVAGVSFGKDEACRERLALTEDLGLDSPEAEARRGQRLAELIAEGEARDEGIRAAERARIEQEMVETSLADLVTRFPAAGEMIARASAMAERARIEAALLRDLRNEGDGEGSLRGWLIPEDDGCEVVATDDVEALIRRVCAGKE